MVKLDIASIAQERGVKSSYELEQRLDTSARTAVRLWKGNMASISLKMIELLCSKLDCLPQDFITYTPEKKKRK
jgi:DNA-binding Xre family transcriptional regulator